MSEPAPSNTTADPKLIHMAKEWALDRPLFSVRFDPTGKYVLTGARNNDVQRWNVADGKRTDLAGHESWVRAFAFTSDGQTMLSGGYDGQLIWWPLTAEKPEPARKVAAHDGWIRALAVSPDGTQIASCGNDNLVKLWSLADGKLLQTLAGHERHVYNVAFHPDGKSLVSGDLMGVIKAWDLATGKETKSFDGQLLHKYDETFWADMGGARGMTFSPDGKQLAVCGVTEVTNAFAGQCEPVIVLFDWEKSEPLKVMKLKDKYRGMGWNVVFHPGGYLMMFCSGSNGGTFGFFQPDATEEFFKFKTPTQGHDFSLSPDGLTAAVSHIDGKLRLYRLAAKEA